MPADASIYQNFLRPPKTIQEYDAEAQQQEQNALALQQGRMQMAALRQQQADDQGLRNYLAGGADLSTPQGQAGLYQVAPKAAGGILKTQADLDEAKAKTRSSNASAAKQEFDNLVARKNQHLQQLVTVNDVPGAVSWIGDAVKSGELPMQQATQVIDALQSGRLPFSEWRQKAMMGGLSSQEQLALTAPKLEKIDNGGKITMRDVNGYSPTFNTDVGQPIAKVATPGEVLQANTSRANKRDEIAADNARSAQGVTYQQDAQGNLIALPTKLSAGSPVSPRVVMGADGKPVQGKGSPGNSFRQQYDQLNGVADEIKSLLPKATASGAGAARDAAMNFVGMSTDAGDAAAKLETLGGWLTSNVPRFEGPQSDKDTAQYRMMAADVGNSKLPVSQRLAKLEALQQFMDKKATFYGIPVPNRGAASSNVPSDIEAILKKHGGK